MSAPVMSGVQLGPYRSDWWRPAWTTPRLTASCDRFPTNAIETNQEAFWENARRRIVNYWRCAATDLPQQGPSAGNLRQQFVWERQLPPVDWALERRFSQNIWLNAALTTLLAISIAILIVRYPTRPYGFWFLLIFGYFAVVTGILEIPAYRYRMVVEPLVASSIGAAIAVLLSRRRKPAEPSPAG